MTMSKETRNYQGEVRASEESRVVEGYALLFDTPSDGLPFQETIERSALDGVIEKSDVFALLNHTSERGILARCVKGKGSLSLTIDDKGLMYRFEAPKTALGDELLENIRRGEINQSSFCFDIPENGDEWRKENGVWYRTIKHINKLYDVSPVYSAAYSKTSVNLRGKEELEQTERENYYKQFEKYLNN